MNSIPSPTEIRRNGNSGLNISWSDGKTSPLSSEKLRMACPCASCRERRGDSSHAAPLTPKKNLLKIVESSSSEELRLDEIWGIGNYALGLRWGDGHDTGIYTYSLLWELGQGNNS